MPFDLKVRAELIPHRIMRRSFYMCFEGPLVTKGKRQSDEVRSRFRAELDESIKKFRWKMIPRAMTAVSFSFFSSKPQSPATHKLVKFYMDELRGKVLKDDRQVGLIEATLKRGFEKDTVYIKVQRLVDYVAHFDLVFELADGLGFEDEGRFELLRDELEIDYTGLHQDTIDILESLKWEKVNRGLFGRIEHWDRPVISKKLEYLNDLGEMHPFSVELGQLPAKGKSGDYKQAIADQIGKFAADSKILGLIQAPFVLNIAVNTAGHYPAKDLDNIVIDIAPKIAEKLSDPDLLEGYRIYVKNRSVGSLKSDTVRLKFLPSNSFQEFQRKAESIILKADYKL